MKAEYVSAYAEEHRKLTINPKANERRELLERDPRLEALRALSAVELLDKGQLRHWTGRLAQLPTCLEFHEGLLAVTPICPSCGLRPSQRRGDTAAAQILDDLDQRLDVLLADWRRALRANLGEAPQRQSIEAMTAAERRPIEAFLAQGDDETAVPDGFAKAATAALRGIQTVSLWQGDLMDALSRGGLPCTREDLERRFAAYLDQALRGHDKRATRLTLADRALVMAAD